MSLGKAAVYKHVAVYYPDNVGSVGGFVGMIGGLGGFVLPIVFGVLTDLTGLRVVRSTVESAIAGTRRGRARRRPGGGGQGGLPALSGRAGLSRLGDRDRAGLRRLGRHQRGRAPRAHPPCCARRRPHRLTLPADPSRAQLGL